MRELGFYLGRGTAVALHLGHRRSVDLDWFTGSPVADPMALYGILRDGGLETTRARVEPGTLHAVLSGVKVSFMEYRYPLLQHLCPMGGADCDVASLDDLACMKLSALAQRGAKKDFLDVYALAMRYKPLPEILALYRRKYDIADTSHVLYALTYFDDAEKERAPRTVERIRWPHVQAAFRRWALDLAVSR